MKILVTGSNGQLGYEVCKLLNTRDVENKGVDINDFDITDAKSVMEYITDYKPDTVVHCSAYTAVDKAEENFDLCHAVNTEGTRNIASACKALGAKMVYISTDYVFPGMGERFWEPDDPTEPLSAYGKTKLCGELAVKELLDKYFIIRISWAFGAHGSNFVKTMLTLSETQDEVNVVSDQIGSPTYMKDLAVLICDMIVTEKYGIYHATNEGICSWAEFAEEIFHLAGKKTKVNYITTCNYSSRAVRPLNSRMSKDKLVLSGFHRLPVWKNALARYLKEII